MRVRVLALALWAESARITERASRTERCDGGATTTCEERVAPAGGGASSVLDLGGPPGRGSGGAAGGEELRKGCPLCLF